MIIPATILKKILPYVIIIGLCFTAYFVYSNMSSKIDTLTKTNAQQELVIQKQTADFKALEETSKISIKQLEEMRKNEKEALQVVSELKRKLKDISLQSEYQKDKENLLKEINNYERCMEKYFNDPTINCFPKQEVKK